MTSSVPTYVFILPSIIAQKTLIGEADMFGHGVPRDHREAVRLLTRSAQEGDWLAQQHLAILHIRGIGIDHNYGMARYYLENLLDAPATGGKYDAFCRRELANLTALEAALPKSTPPPVVQPISAPVTTASQPVVSVPEKFPECTQFRRFGVHHVSHQVMQKDPFKDRTYTVHERSPRGDKFDVTEVKLTEAQLEDGAFLRVENPTLFCTKCKGRGDSYLSKGKMDGYELEQTSSHSSRQVYVGMPDGTYEDCTQCQGTGFQ